MLRTITTTLIIAAVFCLLPPPSAAQNLPGVKSLEEQLADEIAKFDVNNDGVLDHLRTTYVWGPDFRYARNEIRSGVQAGYTCQAFDDLFHNPADTLYTLARVYPHVSEPLKSRLYTYMQSEFNTYQPYRYDHMGTAGYPREINDVPADEYSPRPSPTPGVPLTYGSYNISSGPTTLTGFAGWNFNPFNFYALAKYAEIFNNASSVLTLLSQNGHAQPGALPADDFLRLRPHVLNSYIAGYVGYQRLRQLAGQAADSTIASYLQSAYQKRVTFLPATSDDARNLVSYEAGGFLWLTPELGDYLAKNAAGTTALSINTWKAATAYYMIPNAEEGTRLMIDFYNEGGHSALYDQSSLFLAQAYAQKKIQPELEALLHGPGLYRGDLFYIQNLVAAIEAPGGGPSPTPGPSPTATPQAPNPFDFDGDGNIDFIDLKLFLPRFTSIFDFNTLVKLF